MPNWKKWGTIIALVAVLALVGGYFSGTLDITRVTGAHTATEFDQYRGWIGDGTQGPVQSDGLQHELLDAPRYIGGFYANGHSEKIVADGQFFRQTTSCYKIDKALYRFWFRSIGATYTGQTFTPSPADDFGNAIPTDSPGPGFVLIKEDYLPNIGAGF